MKNVKTLLCAPLFTLALVACNGSDNGAGPVKPTTPTTGKLTPAQSR